MKPIIGIVPAINQVKGQYYLHEDNVKAVEQAGGIPILLPYVMNIKNIKQLLNKIDGLYLTGGDDIDPTLFAEEPHPNLGMITRIRDEVEIKMIKQILQSNKPLLAVCRGSQILNIALGGNMYQDIYSQIETPLLQHSQQAINSHASHYINVEKNSLLYKLVDKTTLKVNSRHHQANRKIARYLRVSGRANDGIIEAIESTVHRFVLGLQWHPENMAVAGDENAQKIYQGFMDACHPFTKKGGV